jgi:hypothetical protein
MDVPAVKAINAGDPPTIEFDTHPAKGSWRPRKSPDRFGPASRVLPLGSFYPKILSSKLIFIIRVYYHRNDHTPMTSLSIRRHARGVRAQTLLLCVFKKTTCWAAFPTLWATIACDDDDATMSMS